jgi:hypothetical protein
VVWWRRTPRQIVKGFWGRERGREGSVGPFGRVRRRFRVRVVGGVLKQKGRYIVES